MQAHEMDLSFLWVCLWQSIQGITLIVLCPQGQDGSSLGQTSPSPAPRGAVPAQQPLTEHQPKAKVQLPASIQILSFHICSSGCPGCLPFPVTSSQAALYTSNHPGRAASEVSPHSGLYSCAVLPLRAGVVLPFSADSPSGPKATPDEGRWDCR